MNVIVKSPITLFANKEAAKKMADQFNKESLENDDKTTYKVVFNGSK